MFRLSFSRPNGQSGFLLGLCMLVATPNVAAQGFPSLKAPRATLKLPGIKASVGVYRDRYGVPHIYAASTEDGYFALGYLHATDRLFQMEMFRRRASGTLAEILGKPLLEDDIFVRQIGIRRSADAVWKSPRLETKLKQEIVAYCAGVNARLHELEGRSLPEPFRSLGITPAPWTPVDALVFPKYMGWDQSGTDTDVWMGMLVEKLGLAAVEELFPLDRPYEIPTVSDDHIEAAHRIVPATTRAQAFSDPRDATGRLQPEGYETLPYLPPGFDEAALELHRRFLSGRFGSRFALGSNNWAIDGKKSATGKPVLANDPHLGLSLPSIWYAAHVVAPGLNVMGVTFAGFPYVVIGHNHRIAWGLTDMQADAVDYFIEKMDAQHPHQYFYKGVWCDTTRGVEEIPVRGEKPVRVEIESTVHGPLVTNHGVRLALQWTGLAATLDIMALAHLNTARNVQEFKEALKDWTVPALNIIYADADGNIAIAPHGALPIRKRGNGRWPMDGSSGDYDWAGTIPNDQLPFALNPPQHYLASANGRPAAAGYPYYLGWMWDPSYRTRRIHQLLRTHQQITVEQMEQFQMDAHDSAAEVFVPIVLAAYERKPFGNEQVRSAIQELRRWDFEATPESVATTIWSAWFKKFREAVWQDEFDAAGVERWSGAWGFNGSNERQPIIEVLEFLTRENPTSPWFDDVRTPEKETRDDILARSFVAAVEQLVKDRGPRSDAWKWEKTNILRLHSLTQQPALDRGGMPVRGDGFTLCPGDDGGPVTGGASWRMVVDFAHPEHSFGVYPGGQSEDPSSPHYDDLIMPWVEGRYLSLPFYVKPDFFQPEEVESVLILEPK
jgi:penicillin amidase